MTPDVENAHLWDEIAQQREQIATLEARGRRLEGRLHAMRWALVLGVLAVLLAVGIGLLIARSQGAFESRLAYWHERGQNCGMVAYGPNGKLLDRNTAERAVACFVAAHARCKAATLTVSRGGTDTEEDDTFVIEPWNGGGGCDVGLHFEGGIVGSNGGTSVDTQCARLISGNDMLTVVGCRGFGDISVP